MTGIGSLRADAFSILSDSYTKIGELGVQVTDEQGSPRQPNTINKLISCTNLYSVIMRHVVLNDAGTDIIGVMNQDVAVINDLLGQLKKQAGILKLPIFPTPLSTYNFNFGNNDAGFDIGPGVLGDLIVNNGSVFTNLNMGSPGTVLVSTPTGLQWQSVVGNGIPSGGTINQYLRKASNTSYDAVWDTLSLAKITDVTATAAEANKLHGALWSTAESNQLVGVTSPIQTQLNSKLGTTLLSGEFIIGNAINVATPISPTGDVTFDNTGTFTIGAGVVINSNISNIAAIARSKLAAGNAYRLAVNGVTGVLNDAAAITANRALVSDNNGIPTQSATTDVQLGYLSATTSDVQNQLNSRLTATITSAAQGDIIYYNGSAWVNLARGTTGQVLTSGASSISWGSATANGLPSGGVTGDYLRKNSGTNYDTYWYTLTLTLSSLTDVSTTATELNQLHGVTTTQAQYNFLNTLTSDAQAQLNNKLNTSLANDAIWVGNASNVAAQLAAGTPGQVLTIVGGSPQWQTVTGTGSVTSINVVGGTTGLTTSGGPVTTTGTITLAGTLIAANGGTGFASYTAGDMLYATGTTTLSKLAAGTNGYVLTMVSGAPAWAVASGGSITGSGTSGRMTFWNGASTITSDSTLLFNSTDKILTSDRFHSSLSADPSATVTDGDWIYNSTSLDFRARINGQWTNLTRPEIVTDSSTARTLAEADRNKIVYFTNGSTITVTGANLAIGTSITIVKEGTGNVVFSPAGGLTYEGLDTTISTQYGAATFVKKTATVWTGFGALGSGAGGGITNSAATNELMKSDGTNAVTSGLFTSTNGNITMGSASLSGDRTISAVNTAATANLNITAQSQIIVGAYTKFNDVNIEFASGAGNNTINFSGGTALTIHDSASAGMIIDTSTLYQGLSSIGSTILTGNTGTVGAKDGVAYTIRGGNAYTTSGDGNGGTLTLKSGQRGTAGVGVDGNVSIDVLNGSFKIVQALANDDALTQVMVRDNSTGIVKYRSASSFGGSFTNPMTTLGDIIYEDATPTPTRLAGNTTSTKKFLTQTGTGSISAVPGWDVLISGDIPNNAANTTGSAAKLTTARNIYGVSFDGTADIFHTTTTAISAAGTTQGTATTLTKTSDDQLFEVTTVGAGQGVVLPTGSASYRFKLVNRGANDLKVYPASTGTIDGGSASAAIVVGVNQFIELAGKDASNNWYSGRAISAGTANYIPYYDANGNLTSEAEFSYIASTNFLRADSFGNTSDSPIVLRSTTANAVSVRIQESASNTYLLLSYQNNGDTNITGGRDAASPGVFNIKTIDATSTNASSDIVIKPGVASGGTGGHIVLTASTGSSTPGGIKITNATPNDDTLTQVLVRDGSTGLVKYRTASSFSGTGDMVLASVQTVTGAKTFNDTKFLLRNVANTFNGSFVNTNTADRIYTLKDANGTLAFTSDIAVGTITGLGTGVATALAVNVGSAGAFVTFNGALGTPSSGTLTNVTGLPISTGLTGGGANRVPYFTSSTVMTTASTFLFDGTNLGIGATPQSVLTVAGQTSIVAPVSSSTAQFVGVDANPLRITFDTHNNASASGTAFMGRRSRGTAASPSALSSGDDIISLNGRGYGTTQYAAASTGLFSFKANQTFTDANNGTYATIFTTPDNSVTAAEALRITGAGIVNAIQSGGKYQINSTDVLSSSTLGSGVTASSLTSFGSTPTIVTPSITTGFTIGGAAASRKIIVGNGTNFVASTETWATPGATNTSLISDGTNWIASTVTRPNSATTGDIPYASASNVYSNLAAVVIGSVLGSAGTSTAPAYLAVSNGATATATTLKVGGQLTGSTTIGGQSSNQNLIFDGGAWTASSNSNFSQSFTSTATARGTTTDELFGTKFNHSLTPGANSQILSSVLITSTFPTGTGTGIDKRALDIRTGRIAMNQTTTLAGGNFGMIDINEDGSAYAITVRNSSGTFATALTSGNSISMGAGPAIVSAGTNGSANGVTGKGLMLRGLMDATSLVAIDMNNSIAINNFASNKVLLGSTITYTANAAVTGSLALAKSTPTWNVTAGTQTVYWLWYKPTETSLTGTTHYGIISESTTAISALGVAAPTNALFVLGAGSTTLAPFKLTSGTNLTTAVAGCFEFDGTTLFFTRTGTTRESILTSAGGASAPSTSVLTAFTNYYGTGGTVALSTPSDWLSVVINGTARKIPVY